MNEEQQAQIAARIGHLSDDEQGDELISAWTKTLGDCARLIVRWQYDSDINDALDAAALRRMRAAAQAMPQSASSAGFAGQVADAYGGSATLAEEIGETFSAHAGAIADVAASGLITTGTRDQLLAALEDRYSRIGVVAATRPDTESDARKRHRGPAPL